ncbi:hypothetical protein VOLCADRAFT_105276 [Volvox carteri f. nagariensis]|uniref:Ergosterol biosynthetic protein 28 n=1 Tax=Volvox carteri f. nagariensis TaxID=3068 RepID=D8TZQ3_VOLCA|nr:uncharacterized protein VOLCADRAFT_105276 [Volvox carteri f. nagariensis]EFJ47056.1 hypothetical protein VOLCADRAFT_105276 [Volvox carteri f. nagariensis]|eukprot:XP_002951951.1 hypothetical protein VOLCADRAFT_105276 [Volvox carteri f. nagariensis]
MISFSPVQHLWGRMDPVMALKRWLVVVASLRMLAVVIGIFAPNKLKSQVFDRKPELVSNLLGRLFAAWTLMTCALCLACAMDPSNKTVYGTTLFSFVVALLFFLSELLVYKTVTIRGALSPMIIASISTAWLSLGWDFYTGSTRS